jgi:phospholipase C
MRQVLISLLLLCAAAFAQTGQCHASGTGNNNGASCTLNSGCTGTGGDSLSATPYCAVLKHIIFIVKENRSFDQYFGRFPGVTGGPIGTTANPYNCRTATGGCPGGAGATLPAIAVSPTGSESDCGHAHENALQDYNAGAMNNFNIQCAASWANAYGTVCADWATSHQVCASNSDCTDNSCTANTLPTYWSYATHYGLADHFFASLLGPSYPTHLYIFAAQAGEAVDLPVMNSTSNGVNGNLNQVWNCDAFHYGRCSNSSTTLCSTSAGCTGGGTCSINEATGFGYYNSSTSCTKNDDLLFSLTNIVGNGTTATATCAANCGALAVGNYVTVLNNSNSGFNNDQATAWVVATVTGSPVTSFTFLSSVNATGTGGSARYDYCVNDNVYQGAHYTTLDADILGGTGLGRVPGTCSANNTQACACSYSYSGGPGGVTNPCTDLTNTCAGTSGNCVPTQNIGSARFGACPNITTIADRLDAGGISWKIYNENSGERWNNAASVSHLRYGSDWTNNVNTTTGQFITDAGNCVSDSSCSSLASVVWANSGQSPTDYSEHPVGTVQLGQQWTAGLVNAVMANPYLWTHSVIFIFHDDWGGFYDHIVPTVDAFNVTQGFRVPAMCVGAFCTNAVITTNFNFESALKCVEVQYGLAAIGARDAAANDICTSVGGMVNLALSNATLGGSATVGASVVGSGTVSNGSVFQ